MTMTQMILIAIYGIFHLVITATAAKRLDPNECDDGVPLPEMQIPIAAIKMSTNFEYAARKIDWLYF